MSPTLRWWYIYTVGKLYSEKSHKLSDSFILSQKFYLLSHVAGRRVEKYATFGKHNTHINIILPRKRFRCFLVKFDLHSKLSTWCQSFDMVKPQYYKIELTSLIWELAPELRKGPPPLKSLKKRTLLHKISINAFVIYHQTLSRCSLWHVKWAKKAAMLCYDESC